MKQCIIQCGSQRAINQYSSNHKLNNKKINKHAETMSKSETSSKLLNINTRFFSKVLIVHKAIKQIVQKPSAMLFIKKKTRSNMLAQTIIPAL